ncbi:MAG TPA: hypothetical protein VMU43_02900 [Candidatus Acidoferrum sp.]|nr:hypothetical protein [Candidatus Acidoferrum sp.]
MPTRTRTSPPELPTRKRILRIAAAFCIALSFFCAIAPFHSVRLLAQDTSETPGEEMVANLAAGRVILLVAKDAIVIATVENPIEVQTHVPAPVRMSDSRVGIVLGAEDWFSPSARRQIARLDQELPRLRDFAQPKAPHLGAVGSADETATDLESIGRGVRRRATEIVQDLHGKIDLPPTETFLEVVVADYLSGYGPEIWQISYTLQQEELRDGFWQTSVSYPSFSQSYPPVKGQPHTLVEYSYPPGSEPTLLDLLHQGDPRFSALRNSDKRMSDVLEKILAGDAQKIPAADASDFLHAAIEILAPPKARVTLSQIAEDGGFSWILPPPPEPKPQLTQPAHEQGAPSLLHP